jgi:hypothetical protein
VRQTGIADPLSEIDTMIQGLQHCSGKALHPAPGEWDPGYIGPFAPQNVSENIGHLPGKRTFPSGFLLNPLAGPPQFDPPHLIPAPLKLEAKWLMHQNIAQFLPPQGIVDFNDPARNPWYRAK